VVKIPSFTPSYQLAAGLAVIGALLLVLGVWLWAALLLLAALVAATTSRHFLLDFERGYCEDKTLVLGFIPFGGRQRLPRAQHVVLKPFAKVSSISRYGNAKKLRQQYFIVLLAIPNSSRGFIVLETEDWFAAQAVAAEIAAVAQLELADYTAAQR
jgi:hypothetical protein